ncbi:16S rRNA (uracil(1498)-N(3))-methyltransferase [Pedobacter yulinensis]|uniref:Ribosomal RNA small subunit methyltransferase E n=1 Tax=Pedobacter yulinensis TaxID=2126353 RepID=A0A2T3HQY1_9SPHI|nr:16S rRNA (uracil(1498)-N(3))-methyltransferase [Pedobacter yulinensis]PST84797.1 16S rRNA (uracil(1498)-N(3))-methyltransferase [Pedobacter yulinensis]
MHIFYTPGIGTTATGYILSEEESKHCIRVLRLKTGDQVQLIDGTGGFYTAVLADEHPKRVALQILERQLEFGKRSHYLHIAVAPTKNTDRLEWFAEKATELGIDEITPLISDRSERRILKTDRLEKVVVAASKQSIKAYVPRINPPVPFRDLLMPAANFAKCIAHCMPGAGKQFLNEVLTVGGSSLVLIGPEGDFTEEEVQLALQNNFKAITLGNARLRTETAALAVCFEENYLNR